jgi:uncharacterized protein YkwD
MVFSSLGFTGLTLYADEPLIHFGDLRRPTQTRSEFINNFAENAMLEFNNRTYTAEQFFAAHNGYSFSYNINGGEWEWRGETFVIFTLLRGPLNEVDFSQNSTSTPTTPQPTTPQPVTQTATLGPNTTGQIQVAINGVLVNFTGQGPVNIDGRVLVPLRAVLEALDFVVHWDYQTRNIRITTPTWRSLMLPLQELPQQKGFNTCEITFTHFPGNLYTSNRGTPEGGTIWGEIIPLDVPAQIINGSTVLPIRAIIEYVGYRIDWDGDNQRVLIETPYPTQPTPETPSTTPPQTTPAPQPTTPAQGSVEYWRQIVEATQSSTILPDRRLSQAELDTWISEYISLGGPNAYEIEVVRIINEIRAEHGLTQLQIDHRLSMAARFYTQTLSNLNLPLGHHGGPYGGSGNTAATFGSSWNTANGSWVGTPQSTVDSWMNSDGHRRNILNASSRSIGIGTHTPFAYMLTSTAQAQAAPPQTQTQPTTTPSGDINWAATLHPSSITLPNRRLAEQEREEWIADYWYHGGPNAFELEFVRLFNEVRAAHNLSEVQLDASLMLAARFYTQIKDDLGLQLGHNRGPYATNPAADHGASANVARAFGANLHWLGGNGAGAFHSPQATIDAWMASPLHRAYMLYPAHRFIGIGVFGGFRYLFLSASQGARALDEIQP